MADGIDFLSGSCKQDVTDLICLSAHLNFNRRLEVAERQRLKEVKGEGMSGVFTHLLFLIGSLAIKNEPYLCASCCRRFPFRKTESPKIR